MGGVRNGNSFGARASHDARPEAHPQSPGAAPESGSTDDVRAQVEVHLQAAAALLREGSAPRAFGELVRASRTVPMTRRMAAALVFYSLKAGTEAAAIMVLGKAADAAQGALRTDVLRQLARVLRRVDQLPRAIEALDSVLLESPTDRRALRVLEALLQRSVAQEGADAPAEPQAPQAEVSATSSEPVAQAPGAEADAPAEPVVQASQVEAPAASSASAVQASQVEAPAASSASAVQVSRVEPAAPSEPVAQAPQVEVSASPESAAHAPQVEAAASSQPVVLASLVEAVAVAERVVQALQVEPPDASPVQDARASQSDAAPAPAEPREQQSLAESLAPVVQGVSLEVTAEPGAVDPHPGPLPEGEGIATGSTPSTPAVPPEPTPALEAQPVAPRAELPVLSVEDVSAPLIENLVVASEDDAELPVVQGAVEVTAEAPPAQPPAAAPEEPPVILTELTEIAEPEPPPAAEAPAAPAARADSHSTKTIEFEALSLEDVGGQIVEPDPSPAPSAKPAPAPAPQAARPAPAPAAPPRPDAAALQKLEAQLIARKKWRELAQLYLDRADRAKADPAERAEALTRLAEVMENELQDPAGAARMYGEIATLTGDRAALKEQVRLLTLRGDPALVQRALDEAVKRATTAKARAAALQTRAEQALASGQTARAWADFDAAESLAPGIISVLAGQLRCAPDPTRAALLAVRLRDTLAEAPRRAPDRLEALKTLAAVAEESLRNARLAQWAWTEVLGEDPEHARARDRLVILARELKDSASLSRLLREQLTREPRGPGAREARMELVATLDAAGDSDGALAELRQAVRMEPGHKEAWLMLVQRCTERGQMEEAAWALEHAATAMEDELERMRTWARLGAMCRDVLRDAARAQVFLNRAENMRQALGERAAPPPQPEEGMALGDDVPVTPTAVLSWEAPPGKMEPARRRARPGGMPAAPPVLVPAPPPAPAPARPVSNPAVPEPSTPAVSEPAALQMVREHPLEAGLYRILADAFYARGHKDRSALMREVADALQGREGTPPRAPTLTLTGEERAGLRHPGLRTPAGELFHVVGLALCRLFPAYGPAAGTNVPILPQLGPGAPAALEALEVASRVLDIRLPELVLSEESGPPFTVVHTSSPRILVGKLAVQQPLPPEELRFHAGRALFCLAPDLLALRSLKKDQLLRGLSFLSAVLYEEEGDEAPGPEGRVLRDSLPAKARERAAKLLEPGMRKLDIPSLAEAARHSANRAGLVVCGGVVPALAVLRGRRALEQEVVELVRFAASERYLQLRETDE